VGRALRDAARKALLACDELTGFVGACCHVREGGIAKLEGQDASPRSSGQGFAAKVERAEIAAGCSCLGVTLEEHVAFVIEALRPHGAELGILAARRCQLSYQ